MSTTESGRTVHWATGLQHQKQKNHGLRASLRFALRPWFQDSHRKWYNYWGQVTLGPLPIAFLGVTNSHEKGD
jgi:hypothetical protein